MPTDLASSESPVPISVVDDAQCVGLPFSRGILATSLLVTGMRTDEAYAIASRVARTLRQRGQSEVEVSALVELAAEVMAADLDLSHAERYQAWRAFRREGRPFVVCLAGASGVGKSTIATRLALRLGTRRIVTTDSVREVLRSVVPRTVLPELHVSSYERVGRLPAHGAQESFELQARAVSEATSAIAHRAAVEGENVLIEGVHVLPGEMRMRLAELAPDAVVVERLLVLGNADVHAAHLHHRCRARPARRGGRHLDHLETIRRTQADLQAMARAQGVREYDIEDPRDLTRGVVDELVDAFQASQVPA